MKFTFHGKVSANENEAEEKKFFYRGGSTKGGNKYGRVNLSVIQSKNNRAFVELFGMEQDPIKTMDTDNNKIDVAWDDRKDADTIKTVASYRKHILAIGDDRKEFIAAKDLVDYIKSNIEEIKDKNWCITGNMTKNEYNGKVSDRFEIQNMYLQDDDDEPSLKVNGEFWFSKDSIDTADFKEEKKLYINGWVPQYINKDEGTKYFPQQLVFDCSKIDFDNEKHVALLSYRLKQIGCSLDGQKIKVELKPKKIYKISVQCNYVNGSEEIPFDEKELTANQREAIALNLKTIDDFRPKGSIYGNRITILKLTDFDLRDKYADGYIEDDMSLSDFEELIYVTPTNDDEFKSAMNEPKASGDSDGEDDELEDLFG